MAAGGWEATSSEAPAGSGSVAIGSSALSLLPLASWSWCRRATSAFRFSKSFWLSRRTGRRVGIRVGLGPPSPYWLCLNLEQDQALCSLQRDTRVEQVLPSRKQKGPRVLKKYELHTLESLQLRPGSHPAFTPSSNPLHPGRSYSRLHPKKPGVECHTEQIRCKCRNTELTKPMPHTGGRETARGAFEDGTVCKSRTGTLRAWL